MDSLGILYTITCLPVFSVSTCIYIYIYIYMVPNAQKQIIRINEWQAHGGRVACSAGPATPPVHDGEGRLGVHVPLAWEQTQGQRT